MLHLVDCFEKTQQVRSRNAGRCITPPTAGSVSHAPLRPQGRRSAERVGATHGAEPRPRLAVGRFVCRPATRHLRSGIGSSGCSGGFSRTLFIRLLVVHRTAVEPIRSAPVGRDSRQPVHGTDGHRRQTADADCRGRRANISPASLSVWPTSTPSPFLPPSATTWPPTGRTKSRPALCPCGR